MKGKYIYITNIIKNIIIMIILFTAFFKNSFVVKIFLTPFLACGFFSIGKNICFLLKKEKYVNMFNKLFQLSFFIFWFGFLIFWSYLVIKEKSYLSLLFTIPFWAIGIYFIRKILFEIKPPKQPKKTKSIFNFQIIVSSFLVGSILLIGIACLFVGIKDTYKLNKITKEYRQTTGYLIGYKLYNTTTNSKKQDITYKLVYEYKVNEKKYTVSTEYGVTKIPKQNSPRKVKYNSKNPKEAILAGTNSKNFLIYFGAFFTLGAFTFILAALQLKGAFSKTKIDIIGLYLGFVFLIVGIGIILSQVGGALSILDIIKHMGFWLVIPILFIMVGIFQIIKCLFSNKLPK